MRSTLIWQYTSSRFRIIVILILKPKVSNDVRLYICVRRYNYETAFLRENKTS